MLEPETELEQLYLDILWCQHMFSADLYWCQQNIYMNTTRFWCRVHSSVDTEKMR